MSGEEQESLSYIDIGLENELIEKHGREVLEDWQQRFSEEQIASMRGALLAICQVKQIKGRNEPTQQIPKSIVNSRSRY